MIQTNSIFDKINFNGGNLSLIRLQKINIEGLKGSRNI